jgi:hypothetical protein
MGWFQDANGMPTTSPDTDTASATPITEILQLMIALMWGCLQLTIFNKNYVFWTIFGEIADVADAITSCSVEFCPGLLGWLQSPTPPTLSQLKALPTNFKKRWGIYLLVLEKASCTPLIYVGSGTDTTKGVKKRLNTYLNPSSLDKPKYVEEALSDGYAITHRGLLAWAPIPAAKDVALFRALFILLEAAFTFAFWSVKAKLDGGFYIFGISSLCHWDVNNLSWSGLSSHNPLTEILRGAEELELSAEELEALAAARRLQRTITGREENRNRVAKNVSTRRFYCAPCDHAAMSQLALERHQRTKHHIRKVKPHLSSRKQAARDAIVAAKKHHCAPCNFSGRAASNLTAHLATEKHQKMMLLHEN